MWSIGDLAKASGVTVRTLYYYDEIGLVPASDRTSAGHRRYTGDDVRRLYRVRALAQLGLSLDEVATVLDRDTEDLTALRDLLHAQLADLDGRQRQLTAVRHRVTGLLDQLTGETMPEPAEFLATLELAAPFHEHLTDEQRDALVRRRAELGADTVDALRSEFLTIVAELRQHVAAGTPVEDPGVRELAARWRHIGETFRTGRPAVDDQIQSTAGQLWRAHGARIGQHMSDRIDWLGPGDLADVVDYVRRVRP